MRHVRPHEWADAERGRLPERRMRRMAAHAAACARCTDERARVVGALATFADIRNTEAPGLRWEHIGARVYWARSSERRTGTAGLYPNARRGWLVGAPLALGVAAVLLTWLWLGDRNPAATERAASIPAPVVDIDRQPAERPSQASTGQANEPAMAAPRPLVGLVTYLQGTITRQGTRQGQTLAMDEELVQGDRIATAAGTVAIQFGKAESITLGAHSTLELAAFDEHAVELSLDGELVVDLSHRQPEQRFVVRAGAHRVVVRGTTFSVAHRDEGVRVVCVHGRVEVSDADSDGPISVTAGQSLAWRGRVLERADAGEQELAELERQVVRVPSWTDARSLRETTATLEVMAAPGQAVEIDGKWAGLGSFTMRVMPGRHLVSGPSDGAAAWHEVGAGERVQTRVEPSAAEPTSEEPKRPRDDARRQRRAQLADAIGHGARLYGCVSALRKQDLLEGAFIELDLGVLADGTINYLNIGATNLQPTAARCIRDVVDGIDFPAGPAVDLRHRIAW